MQCRFLIRFIFLMSFTVILSFSAFCLYFWLTPIIGARDFHYLFYPGASATQLAQDLHQRADLKFPQMFIGLVKLCRVHHKLQSGEYLFPKQSTPKQVLQKLMIGDVIHHKFMIIEGWTIREVIAALKQASSLKQTVSDLNQLTTLGGEKQTSLEGLLFPETYFYTWRMTDIDLVKRAYQVMQTCLQDEWSHRASRLLYQNPYQALIVASLIERETAIPEEKPMIAAIILKRLQKHMPLQIDAAVLYGLKQKACYLLSTQDLKKKTPYNTYLFAGLPPTPIAMPGRDSIHAALHPAQTEALYFVARGEGTHMFSETLTAHQKATRHYRLKRRNRHEYRYCSKT